MFRRHQSEPSYLSVGSVLNHRYRLLEQLGQGGAGVIFKAEDEQSIIMTEAGVDADTAGRLVRLGDMVRNLRQHGLEEGVSTRLLVYAGKLMVDGLSEKAACNAAVIRCMSDDAEMQEAIAEIVSGLF